MKKILITGISGFAGSHLAELLLREGDQLEIYGFITSEAVSQLVHDPYKGKIQMVMGDMNDDTSMRNAIADIQPDEIYHFAAQTVPYSSKYIPENVFHTNVTGTVRLCEAVRQYSPKTRILVVSSALIYGESFNEGKVNERSPVKPKDYYSMTKMLQDNVAQYYMQELNIAIVRATNHTGYRQRLGLVGPDWIHKVLTYNRVEVSNLNDQRDFLDVRDVVQAYKLVMEKGGNDIYNIASGTLTSLGEVLSMIRSTHKRIKGKEVEVIEKESSSRGVSRTEIDNSKITQLGWSPTYSVEDAIAQLYTYYDKILSVEPA